MSSRLLVLPSRAAPKIFKTTSKFSTWGGQHMAQRNFSVISTSGTTRLASVFSNGAQHNFDQKRNFNDGKSTALTLIKDLKHITSTPGPALLLGLGGLIPFVAMPVYMVSSGVFVSGLAFSQVTYGACILSFIGGVRWGTALSDNEAVQPNWFNLGYSVTPSLVAWVALLLPTPASLLTLMAGLAGSAYMDLTMLGYPPWFKALRFLLSLFAILSLWSTLMCMLILDDKKKKEEKMKAAANDKMEKAPEVEKLAAVKPVVRKVEKMVDTAGKSAKSAVNKSKKEASELLSKSANRETGQKDDLEEKELKE
ncbi:transmembrane protein 69-like [Mya arenaria]|uniref:transmembrane protein 69-like n=1 Tax=Mya arenaria TaxID=6604 RepID=UPI0022E381AD|nr:transmembrane protein 69-like [Mya arenaria]XP_052774572.1 transmembrane protein 69-like [Mya arenaria]XP_052774573.1 transmembrane protein 69-like [Mya arenaria]